MPWMSVRVALVTVIVCSSEAENSIVESFIVRVAQKVEMSTTDSDRLQAMDEGGIEGQERQPRWLDPDEQRTWRAFMLSHLLLFEQFERDLQRDSGMPVAYYEI